MGIIQDIFIQFKIIHANVSNVLCAQSAVTRTCDLLDTDTGLAADCPGGADTCTLATFAKVMFLSIPDPEHKIDISYIHLKTPDIFDTLRNIFPVTLHKGGHSVQFGEHLDTHLPGIRRQGWAVLGSAVSCSV